MFVPPSDCVRLCASDESSDFRLWERFGTETIEEAFDAGSEIGLGASNLNSF